MPFDCVFCKKIFNNGLTAGLSVLFSFLGYAEEIRLSRKIRNARRMARRPGYDVRVVPDLGRWNIVHSLTGLLDGSITLLPTIDSSLPEFKPNSTYDAMEHSDGEIAVRSWKGG